MFERFTPAAREVVVHAGRESKALGHDHLGTEHLLLGVLHDESSVAARHLIERGCSLDLLRAQVERIAGRGTPRSTDQVPFTPRATLSLERASQEADTLGMQHVGVEHLLVALLRDDQGVAASSLHALGLKPGQVRTALLRSLGADEPPEANPDQPPSRATWEYTIRRFALADLSDAALNALGAEGWELSTSVSGADGALLIFRRPAT